MRVHPVRDPTNKMVSGRRAREIRLVPPAVEVQAVAACLRDDRARQTTEKRNMRMNSSNKPRNPDQAPASTPEVGSDTDGKEQQPQGSGEVGGPRGLEPTRYGDWEKGGRCIDF